ncbi:MAG: cytochrome c biogenesis protein ResB [Chlorobiales bacterium]|nr:cytochrome c biogenesis protein ResB [Chlorobiales bacterium]
MVVARRRWFQIPWEFKESALFTAVSVIAGFVIQYAASGRGIAAPHLPFNAIALSLFAIVVISTGLTLRNTSIVKWLGGIPLGLCLILAVAILSLIGGVVPQQAVAKNSITGLLGLNQIFSSWPFAVTVLLFLANLGISLSWKFIPFKLKNLQFILFHAGFWIALSCAIVGSFDLQRLVVPINVGKANNLGYTMESEAPQNLPFSIFLHDFSLEEYPPQLLLYDPNNDKLLMDKSQAIIQVRKGTTGTWKGIDVVVLDYIPFAVPGKNGVPEPADRATGIPFAKVRISSDLSTREAWISTGSPMIKPDAAQLGNLYLIMVPGTPKSFRSAITIKDEHGHETMANLEVNHPVSFMGWKLYQMGYDEKAGRWSRMSLIEVIHDPWLPAVYLGFFMIMAGNILFFWNGIKRSGVE